MPDTTNNADVIRAFLLEPTVSASPIKAFAALDALTREMEADIEEGERLNRAMCEQAATVAALDQRHEEDAAEIKRLNHALSDSNAEVLAQAARIATLEAELADAQMAERERIIEILIYGQRENVRAFRYDGDQFWAANEVYLRAARAPKEAQG